MMRKEELINIRGGAVSLTAGLIIISGLTFIIGVIDGFLRPYACHK